MKVFNFINHASIKTEYNGFSCITDPWYVSNAFGSWFQSPSPNENDIFDLIDSNEKFGVIISHGHDDHIDDWFINKHLNDKIFFCSKFVTPGLENRLSKKLKLTTRPIGFGEVFGDFKFKQFINPNFSKYDAVITIETPDFLIIHANDNWHKWPQDMLDNIKKISDKYNENNVFLLIQFGIADCFPVNYEGFTEQEALNIIIKRFENYLKATESNMKSLNLNHMYYYANQTYFKYKKNRLNDLSMYQISQKFLFEKDSKHIQLEPGMSVYIGHKIKKCSSKTISIFSYCLKALENFINKEYKKICHPDEYIAVRFKTMHDEVSKSDINLIASNEVWKNILNGTLTLETIIIGGSGLISTPDININIRNHHMFISKMSYIAQNMINLKGLSFFREFAS